MPTCDEASLCHPTVKCAVKTSTEIDTYAQRCDAAEQELASLAAQLADLVAGRASVPSATLVGLREHNSALRREVSRLSQLTIEASSPQRAHQHITVHGRNATTTGGDDDDDRKANGCGLRRAHNDVIVVDSDADCSTTEYVSSCVYP